MKTMSTLLQQNLAAEIIKNRIKPAYKRKNKKELLVASGYALKSATSVPSKILEQKGVKRALELQLEAAGLTKELIEKSLVDDIISKPKKRDKELKLGAEILGLTNHNKGDTNKTLVVIIANESAQRYAVKAASVESPSPDYGSTTLEA